MDERTIECPECFGAGKFKVDEKVCQPCQGSGVLDFDAMARLYIEARRAALRRSDREREWKRIAKTENRLKSWIMGNSCNPKCRRAKLNKDRTIRKQGNTIRFYRRVLEDNGINITELKFPSIKRGSIKNT